jgi:hypothetical protein
VTSVYIFASQLFELVFVSLRTRSLTTPKFKAIAKLKKILRIGTSFHNLSVFGIHDRFLHRLSVSVSGYFCRRFLPSPNWLISRKEGDYGTIMITCCRLTVFFSDS